MEEYYILNDVLVRKLCIWKYIEIKKYIQKENSAFTFSIFQTGEKGICVPSMHW